MAEVDFAVEAVTENESIKLNLFKDFGSTLPKGDHSREQYIFYLDYKNRFFDRKTLSGGWHALHEPCASHATR